MKLIEVVANCGHTDTITGIAELHGVDYWLTPTDEKDRQVVRILVSPQKRQKVLDTLQTSLSSSDNYRIQVIPLEVSLPRLKDDEHDDSHKSVTTTREELYTHIEKSARLDSTYLLLVMLSTLVAAIGLVKNNIAVVIGAMVIAPLLGPNISFALASSLGDSQLLWKSFKTNVAGLLLAFSISLLIGLLWDFNHNQPEILSRTVIGLDVIALALASGAAAVLSLTTGLSSVLVGVMVAVALLPPTASFGMLLGRGQFELANGAALLLLANIVCINIAAKTVFLFKGIKPRTWLEIKKAKQSWVTFFLVWLVLLGIIVTVILRLSPLTPT